MRKGHLVFRHLGMIAYQEAWDCQTEALDRLVKAKMDMKGSTMPAHHLFFCYHFPVITFSKRHKKVHLLSSEERLKQAGIALSATNRGGDITYHGPGQLVAYPILDLEPLCKDIHQYLRRLEEAVINMLAEYGVHGERIEKCTGVWVHKGRSQPEKIAAFGVRCSHWVSMHGLALNLQPDLSHFAHIVPCGLQQMGVTSLQKELKTSQIDLQEAEDRLLFHLADQFDLTPLSYLP